MFEVDAAEIEIVLGAKRSRRTSIAATSGADAPVSSLAAAGFPGLYATTIFVAVGALASLDERGEIPFPPTCCVCESPATNRLPTCVLGGLAARWRRATRPGPLGVCVPHCATHADSRCARLLVRRHGWSRETTALSFVGWNGHFLSAIADINRRGEVFPPWMAFSTMSAESSGWRQGNGEYWWRQAWEPFWGGMDRAAALDYLARWNAPDEWRARLLHSPTKP